MDSSTAIELNQQKQTINALTKRLEETERKSTLTIQKLNAELAKQKQIIDTLTKKIENGGYEEPSKIREFSPQPHPKSIWG